MVINMNDNIPAYKCEACALFLVTKRDEGDKCFALLGEYGVSFGVLAYGNGTAPTKMLDLLGIGNNQYDVIMCAIKYDDAYEIMKKMNSRLSEHGNGIGFTVPISGHISNTLRNEIGLSSKEDNSMESNISTSHSLIVVITNNGYSEEVMEVARQAGATGGTVLHARGTGPQSAKTFFGITIQPEKDMILIVTESDKVDSITKAIDSDEELKADAHPVSFTLPVNGLCGFNGVFSFE